MGVLVLMVALAVVAVGVAVFPEGTAREPAVEAALEMPPMALIALLELVAMAAMAAMAVPVA